MILYLDTSLVIAALCRETLTIKAHAILSNRGAAELAVSEWTSTEVSSALAIKLRSKAITRQQRATALALYQTMAAGSCTILPVSNEHFRTAAKFIDGDAFGLRAGDALHLAVAAASGATLYTCDRTMAKASLAAGVPAVHIH